MINVNNLFWTIQGEGANWGRRALFVRMPFCNLSCSWCDTSFNTYYKMDKEEFVKFASLEKSRFAVITGGEPTMNKHTPAVIEMLKELGFEIAIETNGTFKVPEGIDFITCSPKRDADYDVHQDNLGRVDEYKYVVDEGFDFKLLDRHADETKARLSLSPEFGNFEKSLDLIIEYIQENPKWRISLQTHKWMKVP